VGTPRTRCYRDGKLIREGFPVTEVSEYLADPANVVWFDLCRDDGDDLNAIKDELGLHDLAIEDVLHPGQRPKIEHFPNHKLLVAYTTEIDPDTAVLTSHEIGAFITERALVTVHPDHGFDVDEMVRRWDDLQRLAGNGVSFLVHGLLDVVVDQHYVTAEQLDEAVDALEAPIFDENANDTVLQRRLFELRKSLVAARRLVLPMREVVNTIMRRDLQLTTTEMGPYFQDVYDHVLRVEQRVDDLRDLVANMLETRLTVRSNRLNQVMKKVTSWAAIIAVPTAVTGFYGQNLPFPGYEHYWGLITSSALMLVTVVALYATFKAKDWL
jgi:magnesium transporter